MKNEPKKSSSGIPLVIIILVFVGVIAGGWWLYSQSKPVANTNANSVARNTIRGSQIPTNAPVGATPPNMLGSPSASVTVEEFADFQCGSCAATHPVMKEIQSTYGSRIKMIFRNYPLTGHDKAYDAATAVEAAGMQDRNKFWALQDQLFTNQQAWSTSPNYKELWADYASKIGLDVPRFQSDMAGIAAKTRVDADVARGRALNVSSTPTIYVNGQAIPHLEATVPGLRRIIDAELQDASAKQSQPAGAPPAQSNPAGSNSK